MTPKTAQHIRLVCGIATAISLTAAGICLICVCVHIYHGGEFTRAIVAEQFSVIALPVYLALALTIGGFVSELFLPTQQERLCSAAPRRRLTERLLNRRDAALATDAQRAALAAVQNRRAKASRLRAIVCGCCAVLFLSYAFNPAHYHTSEINSSMVRAMTLLLPCLTAAFGVSLWVHFRQEKTWEEELALVRQLPPRAPAAAQPPKRAGLRKPRKILLCAALLLLLYGYFTGGTDDVLTKAVNICTECVGLG